MRTSSLVRYIFYDSSALLYTVTGLNRECGYLYTKTYSDNVFLMLYVDIDISMVHSFHLKTM